MKTKKEKLELILEYISLVLAIGFFTLPIIVILRDIGERPGESIISVWGGAMFLMMWCFAKGWRKQYE